jgi:DNA-binding GntR family transcriptional regulator
MPRAEQAAALTPPALGMARSPSLAEQAADAIVTGISGGVLKPGQRLFETELASLLNMSRVPLREALKILVLKPGQRLFETELASLLNMSRVPLREALKILEAQGIVESIPHRGTRIALFTEDRVDHICDARIALERLALATAAPRYRQDPGLTAELDRIIETMERAASRLEWIDVSKADLSFHREICRVSGNDIVQTLWETIARHVFIVFGHEIRDEQDAAIIGPQHRRLRNLLAAGDIRSLHSEIELHILRLRSKKN